MVSGIISILKSIVMTEGAQGESERVWDSNQKVGWWSLCLSCGIKYRNHTGSTPCCGSVSVIDNRHRRNWGDRT